MQKIKRYLIAAALLVPFLATVPALAVDSTSSTTTQTSTTPTQTTAEKAAMQARLEQHKAELKLKLTAAEAKRLQDRCKPAQATIKTLGDKINANVPQRDSAFSELDSHLTSIIAKLKSRSVDTTTLAGEQKTLDTKLATFKTDLTAYKQEISDLQNMDCAADPTAFKSALQAARTARLKLGQELTDIQAYVKNTIKPTLVDLRKQLEATDTTTEPTTKTGGNQ